MELELLSKSIIVGTGLTGIGFLGIGEMFQKLGDSGENRGNKIAGGMVKRSKNLNLIKVNLEAEGT